MKRTTPVLAALACAACGLTALPTPAHAGHDRVAYSYVDDAERRLREAEACLEAARRVLRDACADRDLLGNDLRQAEAALAEAGRAGEYDRLCRELDDARGRVAEAERDVRRIAADLPKYRRDIDLAKEAFLDGCRRDADHRRLADRVADAEHVLREAQAVALEAARCSYDGRALTYERDEATDRLARVSDRGRVPRRIVQIAERDLAEAERRLEVYEQNVLARDECVREASAVVERERRELGRVWQRLSGNLHRDPPYCDAAERLAAAESALAGAEACLDRERDAVASLEREVGRHGDRFVSRVDVAALERDVRRLADGFASANEAVRCAEADVARGEREVREATREYQRALASANRRTVGGACGGDDRGERYRRRR